MSSPSDFNQQVIEEFRTNGGKVGGPFQGAPLLLLTTTGAKSGQPRIAPVVYGKDSERIFVIASKGGAPTNPDWYHNLIANPQVKVEVGESSFQAKAVPVTGEERRRLYAIVADKMQNFREYQEKTTREIPVVILEPLS